MEKTAAVIGINTALGKDLAGGFKNQGIKTCGISFSSEVRPEKGSEALSVNWNRRSPVSAGTVVRTLSNQYKALEHVFLVYVPGLENSPFHELGSASIESTIDEQLKGYTFIIRELLSLVQKKKSISLHIVIYTGGSEVLAPHDAAAIGCIRSLVSGIFTFYQNEEIYINGFESSAQVSGDFADFILKNCMESSPKANMKWFRFQEKSSLFNSLRKSE